MRLTLFSLFLFSMAVSWGKEPGKLPQKDIREVISQQEFIAAGLQRLSEEELLNLSGALYGWNVVPGEVEKTNSQLERKQTVSVSQHNAELKSERKSIVSAKQEQGFGKETMPVKQTKQKISEEAVSTSITSTIVGDFNGWKGNTVFELSNGQVWRQADKKSFWAREKNPKVEITKGFLGTYFLSIEGYGARCKVKRVK